MITQIICFTVIFFFAFILGAVRERVLNAKLYYTKSKLYNGDITEQFSPTSEAKQMLNENGYNIGQKIQVFDGQKWEKTGDIGDNEGMWIEAIITGCSINDYKELLIEVIMVDGRTSLSYYKEGVRRLN